MEDHPTDQVSTDHGFAQDLKSRFGGEHSLGTWTRIYVHGLLACVAMAAVAYLVDQLVPVFDFSGNRGAAVAISIVAILAGPPIIGSVILFVIIPMLGKKEAWRGLLVWDDRLITEVSNARSQAPIVLLNWPSKEIRTMGEMTARFHAQDLETQMAAVYVPTAPQTRLGYIRGVSLDDVELNDWTLKQWQLYQMTFGAVSPENL